MKVLGINLAEFRSASIAGQVDLMAEAFSRFADGSGKTAAAMALLGKTGADMIPFLDKGNACLAADVDPRFETYDGVDPVGYVISLNIHRRHLNESQRAMVAARLANIQIGENQHTRGSANLQTLVAPVSQSDAAKLLNVSTRSVASAAAIRNESTPELIIGAGRDD